jgi:hypothetical protein
MGILRQECGVMPAERSENKTNTPTRQNSSRECKQIAFDHQKSVNLHIELPIIAV